MTTLKADKTMTTYHHLELDINHCVATIWLNRPEVHNAFNDEVINELTRCLTTLNHDNNIRVVVLAGRGKNFSAGADLTWMQQAAAASFEDNQADALNLATMLHTLATLNKPTIARVHGMALGGGMGLVSACDICVASTSAQFTTSEVRLGLAPSTISPYVIRAIGERQARRYFLTAERISAERALAIGLAHEICEDDTLDATLETIITHILAGSAYAQQQSKALIDDVANRTIDDALLTETAHHIARVRQSDDAKEGLSAFLNKRPPNWVIKR